MAEPTRIIGLDPGLRRTGWGIIRAEGPRLSYIACGTVTSDNKAALSERLKAIHEGVCAVLKAYEVDEAAVEETFVNKDARATLKLGQARGVVMLAPTLFNIPVSEYAATQVKKSVVGVGRAEKDQIHAMLKILLPQAKPDTADAADALAIAITHAHMRTNSHEGLINR